MNDIERDYHACMDEGRIARQNGHLAEALAAFRKAAELSPASASACTAVGGINRQLGNFDEAWLFLLRAVEIDPRGQFGWNECGITALHEGDAFSAVDFYMSALSMLPNELHRSQLARALCEAGHFEMATFLAESLIEANRQNAGAWETLLKAARYRDRPLAIIDIAKAMLEVFPDKVVVRVDLVNELIKVKSWEQAAHHNALIKNSGKPDPYVEGREQAIRWGLQSGVAGHLPYDGGPSLAASALLTRYLEVDTLSVPELRALSVALCYAGYLDLAVRAAWLYGNRGDVRLGGKSADFLLNALIFSKYMRIGNLRSLRGTGQGQSPIPKIITLFWDKDIPPDVEATTKTWSEMNPRHTFRIFSDVAAKAFIERHFGEEYAALYDYSHHPAMRADLFRLCAIYIDGGIYSDADDFCRIPIDTWLRDDGADIVISHSTGPATYLHNWFFAAVPGHEVILHTLHTAFGNVARAKSEGRKANIWEDTGPGCLSQSFFRWFCSKPLRDRITYDLPRICFLPEGAFRQLSGWNVDLAYRKTAANWRRA